MCISHLSLILTASNSFLPSTPTTPFPSPEPPLQCAHVPVDESMQKYAGPESRVCPAQVYEYTDADEHGDRKLVINAQNCLHCKACSIKTPSQYIKWTVPEGGGGPAYSIM